MGDESLTFDDKLELRSWGLPDYILEKYLKRGVSKMFPWQVECLMSENVLLGGNLIYSAPTSAGKTLVSEILALKTVLERKKKVIVILPFVSVVREKMLYFQDILCGSSIRVEGFMGSYNPPGGFKNVHLAVCTIEKANNLINRMLEDKNFDDVGCIVVDELHLLGDPHRGYLLELLLTKLKYVCQKGMAQSIQVVGMSATLPNLDLLAKWLNATLYYTEFRPIPLFEYLKVGKTIYKGPKLIEEFELETSFNIPNDPCDVVSLCLDTIVQGFSVLVFCPAKNWCETLAVQISSEIKRIGNEKDSTAKLLRCQLNSRGILDTLEQLRKCPAGLERNLGKSVSFGVGYHHAGLTLDERDIIEGGFRQSIIRVLVATSTLSSGVNLPARRVIIRSPAFQGQCMDILTYKQMIGRAGRMGKDTAGESYLLCTEKDVNWGKQLITSQLPPVVSCLGFGDLSNSLKRALLEVIAGGVVTSREEVADYVQCTLLAASVDEEKLSSAINSCTKYLTQNEFIKVESDGTVIPSSLAEACLSSSVPPDQALYLLRELHKARQCFVLDSDLHSIYQVTPYSICDSWAVDWMRVFAVWEELPSNLQKIGDLVGVEDRFLIRAMRGTINLNSEEYAHKISVHKRFYTCLALQDLINEMPLNDVAAKYGCTKGMLQSLQHSASTFAAMVTSFCRRLGWSGLEVLLSELATRIQFGVQKELLDLLRLDCMTSIMARSLFNAEITALSELASSSIQTVLLAVNKAKPFKSELIEAEIQGGKNIYLPGRPGLSEKEAADILIFEARRFLLKEMGVKKAEWDDSKIELVNDSIYERSTIKRADLSKLNSDDGGGDLSHEVEDNECKQGKSTTKENDHKKWCGKSPGVDLELGISGESGLKKCNALADTFIINSENNYLDISPIKVTDNPEEIAHVYVPESQDQYLNNTSIVDNDYSKDERKKPDVSHDVLDKVKHPFQLTGHATLKETESVSFTTFESNAKLCSTYLGESKNSLDKFSLDPMCGSPNKSDLDFMDSVIERILENNENDSVSTFRTPEPKVHSDNAYNYSNNDIFVESEVLSTATNTVKAKHQLEEFDPDWGGDSLLELSQNIDLSINKCVTPLAKRKASESTEENTPLYKKICLNFEKNVFKTSKDVSIHLQRKLKNSPVASLVKNTSKEKTVLSNSIDRSFGDTIEIDTQLENIIATGLNKQSEIASIDSLQGQKESKTSISKDHIKLMARPKSEGDIACSMPKITSFEPDNASSVFDGTFKLSKMIQEADCGFRTIEDIHISDSEDLINGSPELSQKSKIDLSGAQLNKNNKTFYRSLSLFRSPKKHSITSPKSSPSRHSSPMKYPAIGIDILKYSKSPARKKSLSFNKISPCKSLQRNSKTSASESKNDTFSLKIADSSNNKSCEFPSAIIGNKNLQLEKNVEKSEVVLSIRTPEKSSHIINMPQKTSINNFNCLEAKAEKETSKRNKVPHSSLAKPESIAPLLVLEEPAEQTKDVATISDSATTTVIPPTNEINEFSGNKISDLLLPLASKSLDTQITEKEKVINTSPKDMKKEDKFLTKNTRMIDVIAVGENSMHIDPLYKFKEFVFAIKTKKINDKETQKTKIGGRIVKNIIKSEDTYEPQFKVDDEAIVGLYLYGGSLTYYFNMITLGTSHYRILKTLLSQASVKLYGINLKTQLKLFYKCCGYIIGCKIFDLAIADWLLNPEDNNKTLEELATEYLKPCQRSPVKSENDILSELSQMWSLRSKLTLKLQKANLLKHFEEIEMPIQSKVLFMELTGISFKYETANELWSSSTELMGKLEKDAFTFANHKFSLISNTDLSKIKKELKIIPEEEANHPLIITVQNWRKLHSLKTRNLSQLLFRKESRCHSRSSSQTVTGRIMMHDPDLQHIPRDFFIDNKLFSLRSAFVASPGNTLVSADYSQLELRILAHFSQDPILVPLLRRGDDVFKNIAAEWNGIPPEKVNDELRHQVKQLTYGIIYGMGDKALGEALGKNAADASMLSARFKRTFPKLEEFVKNAIEECRQSGEVKTLSGRVRQLPGINSSNVHCKAQAERQAVNTKIQGSASDIAKKAMIEVENNLNRKFPGRSSLPSTLHTSHLVLQLHDEFIYEVEENILDQFITILRDTMETATFLSVPLPVVVKTGKSWGLLKPVSR